MKLIYALGFTLSLPCFACSPTPDWVPATYQQNFSQSESVIMGTIVKRTPAKDPLSGAKYQVEMKVEKVYKGPPIKTFTGQTESNTCDGFGEVAVEKSVCVFFIRSDKRLISGSLSGAASFCFSQKDLAKDKKDWEKKLIDLGSKK